MAPDNRISATPWRYSSQSISSVVHDTTGGSDRYRFELINGDVFYIHASVWYFADQLERLGQGARYELPFDDITMEYHDPRWVKFVSGTEKVFYLHTPDLLRLK